MAYQSKANIPAIHTPSSASTFDHDSPVAALDIGSNTVRLIVARPEGRSLQTTVDCSAFVRLGLGVDSTGLLQPDREDHAVAAIREFAEAAHSAGAHDIIAVATSAVRDAANGPAFVERVQRETGVTIQIIPGEREAELTFVGATLGLVISGSLVVVDLGGGSGEIIAADSTGIRWGEALPIGSGRLTERFVRHDPPLLDELNDVAAHVQSLLQTLPPIRPLQAVLTGGTAKRIPALFNRREDHVVLERKLLGRAVTILSAQPAQQIAEQFAVEPERAGVLPAGVRALQAIVDFYDTSQIIVSRTGIREGMIVDALQRQGRWPSTPTPA